jgi:hypothetical protein
MNEYHPNIEKFKSEVNFISSICDEDVWEL